MTDNERIVIALQEEIQTHTEAINKIFFDYKSILGEYSLKGLDVRSEILLGIERERKIIEEINISNHKDMMTKKHKMLMEPVHRLSHLFVLLEDESISELVKFNFLEEKQNFRQICKNNNIEYSVQKFPDKKVPTVSQKDIQVYADNDLKCEYAVDNGYVIITQCLEYYKPDITIPEKISEYDVKEIGARAFYGCDEIIAIRLPSTLSGIGHTAFGECKRLRSISGWNIRSTFKVESKAFWKTDIRRIDMSIEQIKYVERDAFEECRFLLNINIHGTGLGSYPFKDYFNVGKQCTINAYQD